MHARQAANHWVGAPALQMAQFLKKDPASFMWEVIDFLLKNTYTTKKNNLLLLFLLKFIKINKNLAL